MAWHTLKDNFLISQNAFFERLKPFKISFEKKPIEKTKEVSNISSFVLLG